jgi:hypothetical protein
MQVLSISEVAVVHGAGDVADGAAAGGALGGAAGVSYGVAARSAGSAILGLGGIGALAGAGIGAAFAGGWAIGTVIYRWYTDPM